jgi:hypothetical protein
MILKASQRGGGSDLAVHLMRMDENDHISVHELRGFASDDLKGAFKEAHAVSLGTKCRQYLFSLSLSPPEGARVGVETFEATIEHIEERLGLQDQPRAIVFHEKEGRRHAHCVWSRIDANTLTARQMSHFKMKLRDISRDLFLENDWKLPRGLMNSEARDPRNFTFAEWQQAKRRGVDPRQIKETVQECWAASDGRPAFIQSLKERGYWLAQGDRRGFVIVDLQGDVHALARVLNRKTKEVTARLGTPDELSSVEATRKEIGERMTPALRAHLNKAREAAKAEVAALKSETLSMRDQHRIDRAALAQQQSLEWDSATIERAARMPRGIRGLWSWVTGKTREIKAQNTREAEEQKRDQSLRKQALIDSQLGGREGLQLRVKDVRADHAVRLKELRREVGMFLKLSRPDARSRDHARERSLSREFHAS